MLIGNYYIGVNVKETMYVGYKSHKPNGIIYKENREQLLCWYNWKRDHVNGQHQRNYYTGLSAIDLINQMSKCIMEKRE